ncbi:hypothetical protein AXA44_02690 [Rhodococcus sp. SC4]|nr:hypothetical protein AXA44_02690 [Rhodococcus sp. SC4]
MSADCFNCSRVVADDLPICTLCISVLIKDLRAVPGIVSDMTVTRARLDRMSRGRNGGKSAETALPIRLDRFDNRPTQRPLDLLTSEVSTWARDLATLTGADLDAALASRGLRQLVHNNRTGKRRDPALLSTETALDAELAAIWLVHHPDQIRRHPAVEELHDGITDAIANARKAVDRLPDLIYKGPCPHVLYDEERQPFTCSADLYAERGEEYVSCPHCWTHHRVSDLDRAMLKHIDDQILTMPELVVVLRELREPVPIGTLYSWHSRKAIRPVAWRQADGTICDFWMRRSDPPLFRVRDVRAQRAKGEERSAS